MVTDNTQVPHSPPPRLRAPHRYGDDVIRRRIDACPKLPSLQSVNCALRDLVRTEQSLTSRIADVIRRDPSLSERLLRMVNSVYFGLSTRVNNIEDAVFFLGLRQIRELALATPVLDEVGHLQRQTPALPWRDLWTHSIGTAILTRELLGATALLIDDDTDYLVGLLHNVGKIVMAHAFPEELHALMQLTAATPAEFCALERRHIGWDHAEIGAYYISRHHLSAEIVAAVRHHNAPDAAPQHALFAAAVQVADHMVRHAGITCGFETVAPVPAGAWERLPGWQILHATDAPRPVFARSALTRSMERLRSTIDGLF